MSRPSLTRSLRMLARAQARIPGISQLLSKRPDMFSLGVWPTYFQKAKGTRVWDLDGNQYTDMSIGGIGANVLGYADADVDRAVQAVVRDGSSSSLNAPEDVELAELLCELHPWAERVRYARTGGEAMAIAVRIARAHTGKDVVAFCGYHGWHDWYLAANISDEKALDEHLLSGLSPRGVPGALKGTSVPFLFNDLERLKSVASANRGKLGAVVLEPIRGVPPTREFIRGVQDIARDSGAVFVVDEISAGFRLNAGGAHMHLGIQPDVAVFSKALGNGYPIAAVIGKADVMKAAESTFISSTYWTERIGPTAALATVRKFRRLRAHRRLVATGTAVQKGWNRAAKRHGIPIEVGGIAPLGHFAFKVGDHLSLKALFIQLMLEKGFLASNQFYSMYAHSTRDVNAYLKAVDETFGQMDHAEDRARITKRLRGRPANAGFKRLVN